MKKKKHHHHKKDVDVSSIQGNLKKKEDPPKNDGTVPPPPIRGNLKKPEDPPKNDGTVPPPPIRGNLKKREDPPKNDVNPENPPPPAQESASPSTNPPNMRNAQNDVPTQMTSSYRFFGAKIRDHPENPEETRLKSLKDEDAEGATDYDSEEDEDYQNQNGKPDPEPPNFSEPTEIIFKHGRVAGLAVDKDFLEVIDNAKGPRHFCLCCSDRDYELVPELRHDKARQGRLILKILLIENLLHVVTLLMMICQWYSRIIHDFVYEQWAIVSLFIVVNHVSMIWSVMYTGLAAHHPADNILLVIKSITQSCVGMFITSLFERLVVMWVIHSQDFPDDGALISLYKARAGWPYTYPIIVAAFLIHLSIMNIIISSYLNFFGGSVKNDAMFWIALVCQLGLSTCQFLLLQFKLMPTQFFHGPKEWDNAQVGLCAFVLIVWEQWRLYNLRLVIMGKKYDLHEKAYKIGALNFCV